MLLRVFFAVILLSLMTVASSQPIIPRFETIGVNDGLSQSSVYSIYQDRLGFMWFGTADGLNRYDGNDIKVFKTKEKLENYGNSNLIRGKLCEDERNNIWFTTETGLYYFDRMEETIKLFWVFPKQTFGLLYYELVFIDRENNLWLFNKGVGFIKIDRTDNQVLPFPYPFKLASKNTILSDAVADKEGNIWFNLFSREGFYRFNTTNHHFDLFFKGENYSYVFFGKNSSYLISENKIYQCNTDFTKKDSLSLGFNQKTGGNTHNIYEDAHDRLWMPSIGNGLFCYDFRQRKVYRYRHENSKIKSLPSDNVTVLASDVAQNLWIGTDGGGVCKLDLKSSRFNLFPLNESDYPLKDYFVRSIYEDDQKRIWFGTNSNGLAIFNPATLSIKNFLHSETNSSSIPGNNVGAIFKDRQNNMWVGTDMGIALYNESTQRFKTIPLHIFLPVKTGNSFVYRISQLSNGDLMAATTAGLIRIRKDSTGNFSGISEFTNHLGSFWTIDFQETEDGDIWMAAPLNGLYHVSFGYGKNNFVAKEKFFSGIDLRSIHRDELQPWILWIASGKGLIRFDTKTKNFDLFNEDDGMCNSYVYGIIEDEKYNLWISTNGGLIYFNRHGKTFQNFSVNDGLQSNEFNSGAFYKGASGNLYFGGIKGFNWFANIEPDGKDKQHKPFVAVTDIFLDDKYYPKDSAFFKTKTIRLAYNQNSVSFNIAVLDFTRPEANKIQYKLEGWDAGWITTDIKTVRYANLSPGKYRFKIRSMNAQGIWSDEESLILFVEAPFWRRWWFYSLIGLFFLIIAIVITKSIAQKKLKRQLRDLEKRRAIEAERNRISKDMHDEIGSGLTQIALMGELMQTQKKADEELKRDVGNISLSARKLVESMSEIIWAMNPQNDSLENLLAYLREQTLDYFEPFDINYFIRFPDDVPFIRLTNEQRRNLFLVAKEALNNALKHSCADEICFSVELKSNAIHFCISDNGTGIDESKIKIASNGLRNMKKRMEDIGGKFELKTDGAGCLIHFSLEVPSAKRKGITTFFTSFKKQS